MVNEIATAGTLSDKASKALEVMRSRAEKADEARTEAAHKARSAKVVEAANQEAAKAWNELATHAAQQADLCRHGADLADRTRRRLER